MFWFITISLLIIFSLLILMCKDGKRRTNSGDDEERNGGLNVLVYVFCNNNYVCFDGAYTFSDILVDKTRENK